MVAWPVLPEISRTLSGREQPQELGSPILKLVCNKSYYASSRSSKTYLTITLSNQSILYHSLSGFLIAEPALNESLLGFQPLGCGGVRERNRESRGKAPGSEIRGAGFQSQVSHVQYDLDESFSLSGSQFIMHL